MLERRDNSNTARSVLLEDFNDLDIYIEDTAVESKKIYKELLKRVFEGKYVIDDIFPIGSCSNVIKEWEIHKSSQDGRKKLFIIDGDFILLNDNLLDKIDASFHEDLQGLYVLPRYCIENFLIDVDSLLVVADHEDPEDDFETIKSKVNFEQWINDNEDILVKLFVLYSIVINNDVGEKTVGYKISKIEDKNNPGSVCKTLVTQRIEYLKSKIEQKKPHLDLTLEIANRAPKLEQIKNKLVKFVSGKDYLMPLIKKRISSKNRFNPDNISLKIRLAKSCNINELMNMENSIM